MIDLHLHSTKSDGTDSPIEILKKAEELKLEYISFTDHENIGAYDELSKINISDYYSGKIITGIELKNHYKGHTIDILGYDIDLNIINEHLEKYFKNNTHAMMQTKYLNYFYKQAEKLNLKLTPIEQVEWNPDNDWASIIFFVEMKRFEENKDKLPEDLWNNSFKYFKQHYQQNKDSIFYIDKSGDYPSPQETIDAIHRAGGKAFLAHVYEYAWIPDKEEFLNEIITTTTIDGIECYHSIFTQEQIDKTVEFAKSHNLLMSGGSDYHGNNKSGIYMGIGKGILNIDKSILSWIKK